ncbi:MAG: tRNA (guanosine(37)-N1)-methyltransferase TrmD [Stappiaceae bacterium]
MTFKATILTLYPDMFPGMLGDSLAGRGLEKLLWELDIRDIREYGRGRHRAVDDTPAGGGPGMVIRPDVLAEAIDGAVSGEDLRPKLLMSPRGRPFRQEDARHFAKGAGVVLVCGRFEGVDQRVIDKRALEEVSIGDFVLSGGEVAAQVVLDAIVRLIPGIMGNQASGTNESFENGLLEHPHYTRPKIWEGVEIPSVLTSGNHKKISEWQHQQAIELTRARRPDLWKIIEDAAEVKT